MRNLILYLKEEEAISNFLEIALRDKIINKLRKEGDEYLIEIDDSIQDNLSAFYSGLGIYLTHRYLKNELKKYPKKYHINLETIIICTEYFSEIMAIEIERYFNINNMLKETIFLKYNVVGLKEEIELMFNGIKYKEEMEEYNENLYKILVENGVDVNKYKSLEVEFKDGDINLKSVTDNCEDFLNIKNLKNKLGMSVTFDTMFEGMYNIAFCLSICMMLKVKELIIPKVYEEFYLELIKMEDFNSIEVNIILGDD